MSIQSPEAVVVKLAGQIKVNQESTLHGPVILEGMITGANTLKLDGASLRGVLAQGSNISVISGGHVYLLTKFTGLGSVNLEDGGVLESFSATFSGTITQQGGTLIDETFEDTISPIVVKAPEKVALLQVEHKKTLGNPLTLERGKLNLVSPDLTLTGLVTINKDSEMDTAGNLTLAGTIAGSGQLTLGGTGTVFLSGTLSGKVMGTGKVNLLDTLQGTGSLTVNGGELTSNGARLFSGQVTLQAGTARVDGFDPLGTGILAVNSNAGQKGTITALADYDYLGNSQVQLAGMLFVEGKGSFGFPQVTVTQAATVDVSGCSMNCPFGLGGPGLLTVNSGFVEIDSAFSGQVSVVGTGSLHMDLCNGAGSVTVNGGTLTAGRDDSFTGQITLQAGTIKAGTDDALGGASATLIVKGKGGSLTDISGNPITLHNALQLQSGTFTVSSGDLAMNGPVTMTSPAHLNTSTGTKLTLGGTLTGNLIVGGSGGEVDLSGTLTVNSEIDVVAIGTVVKLSRMIYGKVVPKGGTVRP